MRCQQRRLGRPMQLGAYLEWSEYGTSRVQDRYAGDIGDYVKLALLRALSPGMKLGVAWYLFPNEDHNDDGRHTAYLSMPERWRWLDPHLFDQLQYVVGRSRSVDMLGSCDVLDAVFFREPLKHGPGGPEHRSEARFAWFSRVKQALAECDLVFADPDNGLTDDLPHRRGGGKFGKQLPLHEALALADGRSAVFYHHNSRFKGGHDLEVEHWRSKLGGDSIAVRANAFSCRTFFIVNPTPSLIERAKGFSERWAAHKVRLHR